MAHDLERSHYNRRKCHLRLGHIWEHADCRSSGSRNWRGGSEYVSVRGESFSYASQSLDFIFTLHDLILFKQSLTLLLPRLVELVICDVVPLRERSKFMAIILGAFTVGTAIGPFLGGIIVQSSNWRVSSLLFVASRKALGRREY
jgi:hypothetical protein